MNEPFNAGADIDALDGGGARGVEGRAPGRDVEVPAGEEGPDGALLSEFHFHSLRNQFTR